MALPPELIADLLKTQPKTIGQLSLWKRRVAKEFAVGIISNQQLLNGIRSMPERSGLASLERLLRVREVRTLSGVAIITVLVKPYACPGQCVYCPTEVRMPKSYIETEPAAQRALRLNFDPYEQMVRRLAVLEGNGHPTDKIELIVKGGTWSAYPKAYQRWFLKECYRAANEYHNANMQIDANTTNSLYSNTFAYSHYASQQYSDVEQLNQGDRALVETYNKKGRWATGESTEEEVLSEQHLNETASHRIIGLTLETRPDWINEAEVRQLRVLGCTRVELGAQAIDDDILTLIKRGHDVASIAHAIALLREAGFKVDLHMMPQLPGATAQKDIEMFRLLFDDPRFRPDMVKIYPCVVTPSAELYQWWKSGKYTPYSDNDLIETLITIKSQIIPRYCRISRLIRDIPSQHIAAGNAVTNLRETVQKIMRERGLTCQCLRCREVGHHKGMGYRVQGIDRTEPFVEEYEASDGKEYFLSFESEDREVVYAFCRLRIPTNSEQEPVSKKQLYELLPEIRDCAFIRELHTYGQLVRLESGIINHESEDGHVQHIGLGRQLMKKAEDIVKEHGILKVTVIAGVGVREYYRKLGYELQGTYMVKQIMD
ncbi:tRNA uridine(34) 5-carboxymethylaminomethyl modification radical SAM/GNAT enzyme Elp3 [Candidatus Uhrbacteria bacterium]|nr:tRNA uridine(34) 5-carboxymethylaminomethyl modification radical SAM/GNAT enzyme Elp3 [Candidatus Uhrbacteria bacterium]